MNERIASVIIIMTHQTKKRFADLCLKLTILREAPLALVDLKLFWFFKVVFAGLTGNYHVGYVRQHTTIIAVRM